MRKAFAALVVVLGTPLLASAQEHRHAPARPAGPRDTVMRHDTPARVGQNAVHSMTSMMGPLGISMNREGSGTSWLPDSTPMYAYHRTASDWAFMLHGNAFVHYVRDGGRRGDGQLGSTNWVMGMARRTSGAGSLSVRAMLSAEPLTVGECGYPDLLATGESCDGERLHDRQHPHDLFMELASSYERELTGNVAFQLYGGLVGEPALGPTAFPHRISAMPGPLATIGHHWQDATHIAFGVVTAAVYGRRWKVEGSAFNGREPDEHRFDFDLDRLDSYSGRVTVAPNDYWTLQASTGRLTEAEPSQEVGQGRIDVTRTTASVTNHQPLGSSSTWANTVVWGQNRAHGLSTGALLLESSVNFEERNIFFGRGEIARKSGEDLVIEEDAPALSDDVFTVGKLSLGYVRQFGSRGALVPGIGAQISASFIPSDLGPFYGNRTPVGVAIFASLRPRPMRMHPMTPIVAGAPGHVGHAAAAPQIVSDSAATPGHAGQHAMPDSGRLRLMHEIHERMMADPVIRERVATDPVLQQLMQRMSQAMRGDPSSVHAEHPMAGMTRDTAEARQVIEFVTLLLSDPTVEARVHADPRLHRLWSDPDVQRCLETMRRLKSSGQPLPAACPAATPRRPPEQDEHDGRHFSS